MSELKHKLSDRKPSQVYPDCHDEQLESPEAASARWKAIAGLLAALCILLFLQTLLTVAPRTHFGTLRAPESPLVSADCILPLGGGQALPGGTFLHFNYTSCKPQLDDYFQDGGVYYAQVAHVAAAAKVFLVDRMKTIPPTTKQVFVFDIDETVLSNKKEWTQPAPRRCPHAARQQAEQQQAVAAAMDAAKQTDTLQRSIAQQAMTGPATWYAGPLFASITPEPLRGLADSSYSPALEAVRDLYLFALEQGYSVAFVTGRKEAGRKYTEGNLKAAGYGSPCKAGQQGTRSSPCYVALHLRDQSDDRPASVYKPERRKAIMDAGYTVIGNIGDQFSDLEGLDQGISSWKLPNPIYYIL